MDVWKVAPHRRLRSVHTLDVWLSELSGNNEHFWRRRKSVGGQVRDIYGSLGSMDLFRIFSPDQFNPNAPGCYDFVARTPDLQEKLASPTDAPQLNKEVLEGLVNL